MKRLIADYLSEEALRRELNELARMVFHFDFEAWVQSGGDVGDYIPYSYEENGRLIANASANIMLFQQGAQVKRYIQIGTVMTAPDSRRRGYASELVARIIKDWQKTTDGIYLFADLSAAEFYQKLGFQGLIETRCFVPEMRRLSGTGQSFKKVSPKDSALAERYRQTLREAAVNADLEQLNRWGLTMFYTADLDQVYYAKDIDCFICLEAEEGKMTLNSIVSRRTVQLQAILQRLPQNAGRLDLGFTPKAEDLVLVEQEPYDGGEDYRLFYIGNDLKRIETDGLFFPALSHA